MGIGLKLIIVFLLLISIPMGILGVMSYNKAKSVIEDNMKIDYMQMNKQIENYIDAFVESNNEGANQMSKDPNVQNILSDPKSKEFMLKSFKSYAESHKNILNIYLGTKDKAMFMYPNAKLPEGFDPTSRPWYEEALEKNDIIWNRPL